MPVNGCCCTNYRLARKCSDLTVSTVGMTTADAAIVSAQSFKLAGACYYFNFADALTPTAPATLTTPAGVSLFADCTACPLPEACLSCVNPRYRIMGYHDGDFTHRAGGTICATAWVTEGSKTCNGGGLVVPWDGTFWYWAAGSAPASGICIWTARCNNTATGTITSFNQCCSNRILGGGGSSSVEIVKQCVAGSVTAKTLIVTYNNEDGGGVSTLWQGEGSHATQEIAGVYTRTGGDDSTASLTIEAF